MFHGFGYLAAADIKRPLGGRKGGRAPAGAQGLKSACGFWHDDRSITGEGPVSKKTQKFRRQEGHVATQDQGKRTRFALDVPHLLRRVCFLQTLESRENSTKWALSGPAIGDHGPRCVSVFACRCTDTNVMADARQQFAG